METRTAAVATGSWWTARQRQAHSLHEISYRGCFKPQLPEYFIGRFTDPGDLVADPFMGRGTTPLQAHLMGRQAAGSDINPLCAMLAEPRFAPPRLEAVAERLRCVLGGLPPRLGPLWEADGGDVPLEDLLAFYHPATLSGLLLLKRRFREQAAGGGLDPADRWIRMVCCSRLSGHGPGFLSVRTLPPNLAASPAAQRRLNDRSGLTPGPKNLAGIVLKKSRSLLRSTHGRQLSLLDDRPGPLSGDARPPRLETAPAGDLFYLADGSVDLVVTSPPFLDIVDYEQDNWLRAWFAAVDIARGQTQPPSSVDGWEAFMRQALAEMSRVLRAGGRLVCEVGEVRNGQVLLEEVAQRAAEGLPLRLEQVIVNRQRFTKTAHIWGVENGRRGTNTNRVVVWDKPGPR